MDEELLIPQWAIVVIVIGVGSLIFVTIFGVTVVRLKLDTFFLSLIMICINYGIRFLVIKSSKTFQKDSNSSDQRYAERA